MTATKLRIGDRVRFHAPGHRRNGEVVTIITIVPCADDDTEDGVIYPVVVMTSDFKKFAVRRQECRA